jgi:type IV fimbrial biogenesis protein FimT
MARRGFTLVELLVTLVVALLALSLALPSFRELVARERGTAAVNQLVGAIALARSQAILARRTVTLCPGNADGCLPRDQWHRGAVVFLDHDRDGRLDAADEPLRAFPPLAPGERVYWRAFRSRPYLQFHPRGYTAWQNGSFLFCPPDGRAELARMAIVNAQGRVRLARDSDGDGIAEDARGRRLRCP